MTVDLRSKTLLILFAGAMGVGLLGGAAVAAFGPVTPQGLIATVVAPLGQVFADRGGPNGLQGILDGLVSKGIITPAQRDQILAAVKGAAVAGDTERRIFADLLNQSAQYLGLTQADLRTRLTGLTGLTGKSLADVANTTTGKNRDGLVAFLTNATNGAIDKAVTAGTLSTDQAATLKAGAPARIQKFVDQKFPAKQPGPRGIPGGLFPGNELGAARDYLGLTQQDITTALRAGKSLGDIATATSGKSRDGLVAALTKAANDRIDQAQTNGRITADQATAAKAKVNQQVQQQVDRKGAVGPLRGLKR